MPVCKSLQVATANPGATPPRLPMDSTATGPGSTDPSCSDWSRVRTCCTCGLHPEHARLPTRTTGRPAAAPSSMLATGLSMGSGSSCSDPQARIASGPCAVSPTASPTNSNPGGIWLVGSMPRRALTRSSSQSQDWRWRTPGMPTISDSCRRFRLGDRYGGSLEVLTRGMGLWLYLAGRDSVTWTRDAVDEGLLRSKVLRPGWNLVKWMGLDSVAFRAAVDDLGASLIDAASWNPETQRFVALDETDDASAESRIVRRGEVFWVHSSTWRQWWQDGDSSDLVFLLEVPEAR